MMGGEAIPLDGVQSKGTVLVRHEFRRPDGNYPVLLCLSVLSLEALEQGASSFLGLREMKYLSGLRFEARRRTYLLGRYCAKEAIAAYLGRSDRRSVEIIPGVFQQPVVVGADTKNVQVSISHGPDFAVAIAFDEAHPMGVDMEAIDPRRLATMESQMTSGERAMLAGMSGGSETVTTLAWTAKEALSKVLRTGMTTAMSAYELESFKWVNEERRDCLTGSFSQFRQYKVLGCHGGSLAFSMVLPARSELTIEVEEFKRSLNLETLRG